MKKVSITLGLVISFALGWSFNAVKTQQSAAKVTGIGGIFFKCKDPQKMREWYSKNLGLKTNAYGATFEWYEGPDSTRKGQTQWTPFKAGSKYFEPSTKDFMINYRVAHLDELLMQLQASGITVTDQVETYPYGRFVHMMDPEGNKIELWEPK